MTGCSGSPATRVARPAASTVTSIAHVSGQSCGHAARTIRSDITRRRRYTMHDNGSVRHDRHYTLEQAREQLPWVEERLAALRDARARLTDAEARQALADGSPTNGGGAPGKVVGEAFVEASRTASRPSTPAASSCATSTAG